MATMSPTSAAPAVSHGVVNWFSAEKGYGFIDVDGGTGQAFVHYSEIAGKGFRELHSGERVDFDLVRNGARWKAKNVTRSLRSAKEAVRG